MYTGYKNVRNYYVFINRNDVWTDNADFKLQKISTENVKGPYISKSEVTAAAKV